MKNVICENGFSDAIIEIIWKKATKVHGIDPAFYRKDANGAWIKRQEYGVTGTITSTGWEIDHILPKSKGGLNQLENLQPLQWMNNRTKSNDYPHWTYSITAVPEFT